MLEKTRDFFCFCRTTDEQWENKYLEIDYLDKLLDEGDDKLSYRLEDGIINIIFSLVKKGNINNYMYDMLKYIQNHMLYLSLLFEFAKQLVCDPKDETVVFPELVRILNEKDIDKSCDIMFQLFEDFLQTNHIESLYFVFLKLQKLLNLDKNRISTLRNYILVTFNKNYCQYSAELIGILPCSDLISKVFSHNSDLNSLSVKLFELSAKAILEGNHTDQKIVSFREMIFDRITQDAAADIFGKYTKRIIDFPNYITPTVFLPFFEKQVHSESAIDGKDSKGLTQALSALFMSEPELNYKQKIYYIDSINNRLKDYHIEIPSKLQEQIFLFSFQTRSLWDYNIVMNYIFDSKAYINSSWSSIIREYCKFITGGECFLGTTLFPGINNLRNTCYLNVVFQALSFCPLFREVLFSSVLSDPIYKILQKLFSELSHSFAQFVDTSLFVSEWTGWSKKKKIRADQQQDSAEFFLYFIDSLGDSFSDIFSIKLETIVRSSNNSIINQEVSKSLMISLDTLKKNSLERSIESYFNNIEIEEPKNGKYFHKTTIKKLPRIVSFELQNISYSDYSFYKDNSNSSFSIPELINLKEESEKLEVCQYQLYSLVCYTSNGPMGHYISLNCKNNCWILCNDRYCEVLGYNIFKESLLRGIFKFPNMESVYVPKLLFYHKTNIRWDDNGSTIIPAEIYSEIMEKNKNYRMFQYKLYELTSKSNDELIKFYYFYGILLRSKEVTLVKKFFQILKNMKNVDQFWNLYLSDTENCLRTLVPLLKKEYLDIFLESVVVFLTYESNIIIVLNILKQMDKFPFENINSLFNLFQKVYSEAISNNISDCLGHFLGLIEMKSVLSLIPQIKSSKIINTVLSYISKSQHSEKMIYDDCFELLNAGINIGESFVFIIPAILHSELFHYSFSTLLKSININQTNDVIERFFIVIQKINLDIFYQTAFMDCLTEAFVEIFFMYIYDKYNNPQMFLKSFFSSNLSDIPFCNVSFPIFIQSKMFGGSFESIFRQNIDERKLKYFVALSLKAFNYDYDYRQFIKSAEVIAQSLFFEIPSYQPYIFVLLFASDLTLSNILMNLLISFNDQSSILYCKEVLIRIYNDASEKEKNQIRVAFTSFSESKYGRFSYGFNKLFGF